eukprot:gene15650-biopygen2423
MGMPGQPHPAPFHGHAWAAPFRSVPFRSIPIPLPNGHCCTSGVMPLNAAQHSPPRNGHSTSIPLPFHSLSTPFPLPSHSHATPIPVMAGAAAAGRGSFAAGRAGAPTYDSYELGGRRRPVPAAARRRWESPHPHPGDAPETPRRRPGDAPETPRRSDFPVSTKVHFCRAGTRIE